LFDGEPITRSTVKNLLQKLKKSTGIEKTVRAHMFRHTRATHMIRENYQESAIKKSLWGNINTPMFATYVNLGESDIDEEFLRRAGVDLEQDEVPGIKPKTCPNCHTVNVPNNEYCYKCGRSFTPSATRTEEDLLEKLRTIAKERPEELIDALKNL
jgi:integrase/recombinase XerD